MGTPTNANELAPSTQTITIFDNETAPSVDTVIDASPYTTTIGAHNKSSPAIVSLSDSVKFSFHIDSSANCSYAKTVDAGVTWSTPVTVDTISTTDCIGVSVWYDRWTPGDNTGNNIHIATWDTGTDAVYYTRFDTSTDTFTTSVITTADGTGFAAGTNFGSITKSTEGVIYVMLEDDSTAINMSKCDATALQCTLASNWSAAGSASTPFTTQTNNVILMPLTDGDILAIRYGNTSLVQSREYDASTDTWQGAWLTIDGSFTYETTYLSSYAGASINRVTGDIYLAYVNLDGELGSDDDDIVFRVYDGTDWSLIGSTAEVLTNSVTLDVTGVKVAFDENLGDVYVVYSARASAGDSNSANVYYKKSEDYGVTWGTQTQLNSDDGHIYGVNTDISSSESIQVAWYNGTVTDFIGTVVADLTPPVASFDGDTSNAPEGTATHTVTVNLSYESIEEITVDYVITAITATEGGEDFTATDGTLTFAAGETSKTIDVTIVDDITDEEDETIEIALANPFYTVVQSTTPHTISIVDNDEAPEVEFTSASQASIDESGNLTLTVELSNATGRDVTVPYTITGTATGSGTDYTISASPIIILAGETTGTAVISIVDDFIDDEAETVIVTLDTPTNATLGATTVHTATLTDDDDLPSITLSASGASASENGGEITVTATLSEAYAFSSTINLGFTGTGVQNTDYFASASSIFITAGNTTGSVTVTFADDTLDENNETVIVDVTSATQAEETTEQQVTLSITDDDAAPGVTLAMNTATIAEASASAIATATLDAVSGLDVTVNLGLTGTATDVTDYTKSASSIVILAGSTTGTVTYTSINDTIDESDETVVVDISSVTNGTETGTQQVSTTIVDDDLGPNVTLGVSGTPFDEDAGVATVTATLDALSEQTVTVNLVLSGTATDVTDFTKSATFIAIAPGSLTGTVTYTGVDDAFFESGETVIVDIDTVTNGTETGSQQVTATITDDDPAPGVTLSIAGESMLENAGVATVTATLDAISGEDVTVNLALTGTATDVTDYTKSGTSIVITAGSTTGTATYTAVSDVLDENDETIIVDIDSVVNALETGSQFVTATIADDDTAPTVTLGLASSPFDEGGGVGTVTATLSAVSGLDVTVFYAYTGTATPTTDYTSSASVVITAGTLSSDINLIGVEDASDEVNETIIVDIASVSNGTESGTQQVTATIEDNDAAPLVSLSITGSPLAETAGAATVTATLSDVSSLDVTVTLALGVGTATNTTDFTLASTSLVILAGNTTQTTTITGVHDTTDEANETVIVDIDSVLNGTENGVQSITATITDDDSAPTVSFTQASQSITEAAGSASVTAQLSAVSAQDVTVEFSISGSSTALDPADYTISVSPITITAGSLTSSATITIVDDAVYEATETVIVSMGTLTNATAGLVNSQTVSITDNDTATEDLTIDLSGNTTGKAHNNSQPSVVTVDDVNRYAFYVDANGTCVYSKTTDGGASWSAATSVNTVVTTNCVGVNVWYDQWTPDDFTGTVIHIASWDDGSGTDELYYTSLDTVTDTLSTATSVTDNTGQTGDYTFGVNGGNYASITKGTDGALYMGNQDVADSFVVKCLGSCDTDTNWVEAGTSPFAANDNDYMLFLPLADGDILLINWDISANDLQSKVYDDALDTWDAGFVTIDADAVAETTSYQASLLGATVDKTDSTVYLVYGNATGSHDIKFATYASGAWTPGTDILTDSAYGVTGAKIAIDDNTGDLYAIYTAQTTSGNAATGTVFSKISTDGGATWGAETTLSGTSGDLYGASVDLSSQDTLTSTWFIGSASNQIVGALVADLDLPTVHFTSTTSTSAEATSPLEVELTLSSASHWDVVVDYVIVGGTATNGSDYTVAASGTVTIPAGSLTQDLSIVITDDSSFEDDETIEISISNPSFAEMGVNTAHVVTITDDDVMPTVDFTAASQSSVDETGTLTLTATLDNVSGFDVIVPFTITGGTATEGVDYSLTASPINILAGDTTGTATLTIISDTLDELDETVIVEFDAPTNATLGTVVEHTATLTDDDAAPDVSLSLSGSPFAENGGLATVTATLDAESSQDVTINLGFTGTATDITDYTASAASLVILAGDTSGSILLTAVDDVLDESDETIIVDVTSVTNGTELVAQQVTATITDNDITPSVTLSLSGSPFAEAAGVATVTATLSGISGQDVTVNLTTSGTATNVTDYTLSSHSIVVTAGSTTGTATLTAVSDTADEDDETVIVDLDSVTGATENSAQQVTATITDDDAAPTVTLGVSGSPALENAGVATVTATLSAASSRIVTVNLGLTGTATDTTDFTKSSSSIVIAAGDTTGTTTYTSIDDALDEADETIIVDISSVTNGIESGTQQVTSTITDDDAALVTLSLSGSPIAEASGVATVTATLSTMASQDVVVNLALTGTATDVTDYTKSSASITITAGNTTGTATYTAVSDTLDEATETIVVDIDSVTNATESGTQQVTATIVDDDLSPTVTIASTGTPLAENAGVGTVTATLSAISGQDVTINLSLTGTATDVTDYTKSATSISILAGNTTGTVTYTGVDDALVEGSETIIVDISTTVGATESGTQQATLTITDDEATPTITLGLAGSPLAENAGVATVTATMTAAASSDVTINLLVTGTATTVTDYTASSASIVITAGNTTGTVTYTGVDDALDETDETIIVDIDTIVGPATESGTQQVTATITDDEVEPTVTLGVSGTPMAEASGVATVTATLSAISGQDVTVNLALTGTATDVTDYTKSASAITVTAGNLTGSVTYTAVSDASDEPDTETIIVDISTVTGATESGTQQVTMNITDDDASPTVTLSTSAATFTETETAVVTATLSAASFQNVTVSLSVSGTATDTTDYSASASTILITAGNTTGTVVYTAVSDADAESDETIIVDIASVTGGTESGTQQVTLTLENSEVGVTLTESSGATNLTEGGAADSYTLVLTSEPTDEVTVDITSDANATASASSVVFDATNWDVPQTITVTAVDDATDEGNHTATLTHTVTSLDANYDGLAVADVVANITDNDGEGISVTETSGSTLVSENGTTDSYTLVLTEQPSANVVINLSGDGEVTPSSSVVTFTTANWDTAQTITVSAVDDGDTEGQHTGTITHVVTSGDAGYNGLSVVDVIATIVDDESAGVDLVQSGSATLVTEGGATDSYTVVLTVAPSADVVLSLEAGDQLSLSTTSITFTTINWATPVTVTVTAEDDDSVEGSHFGSITHTIESTDLNYDGLSVGDVTATITDNDTAGVEISESSGGTVVSEAGITDTYEVVLTSQPTDDVVVTLTPDDQVETDVTVLTFTTSDWDVPQEVVVSAAADDVVEGTTSGTITHEVTSTDTNFDGVTVDDVSVLITDDDAANISVTHSSGSTVVSEDGTTDTLSVVLESEPTADVTVNFTANDRLVLSSTALVFTSANWDTVQTITVSADDNDIEDGDETVSVFFSSTSLDDNYENATVSTVLVSVTDNDEGTSSLNADAGSDFTVLAGSTITLNATNSTGDSLAYVWSVIDGDATIASATSAITSVTLDDEATAQTLVFRLVVTDAFGNAEADDVTVRVVTNEYEREDLTEEVSGIADDEFIVETITTNSDGEQVITLTIRDAEVTLPAGEDEYYIDVSADGFVVIGLPEENDSAGAVYFAIDSADDLQDTDLAETSLTASISSVGFAVSAATSDDVFAKIEGTNPGDRLGNYISFADLDADGTEEIIIGVPGLGFNGGVEVFDADYNLVSTIESSDDFSILSVLSADFINTDGDDLFFGPDNEATNDILRRVDALSSSRKTDRISVLSGDAALADLTLDDTTVSATIMVEDDALFVGMARGDLNNDGEVDLAVSDDNGGVYIFFGQISLGAELTTDDADVTITGGSSADGFGQMLLVADASGDDVDDLLIGAPLHGDNTEGAIYIVFGTGSLADINVETSSGVLLLEGANADDSIGSDLLVYDEDNDGVKEIYTIRQESTAMRFNITVPDGSGSGDGDGDGDGADSAGSGCGCVLSGAAPFGFSQAMQAALFALMGLVFWGLRRKAVKTS